MDTFRYWVAVLLVVTVPPGVLPWYMIHPWHRFWRRLGPVWTWVVTGPVLLLSMVGLWSVRTTLIGRDLGTHGPWMAVGVALYGVSIYFEMSARRHLSLRTLTGIAQLRGESGSETLLQSGIYGRVRHPRYVAVGLGVIAWGIVANFSGVYLLLAVVVLALAGVTVFEERELVDRFGDRYRAYQARVPRLVPRLGPVPPPSGDR